MHKPCHVCVNCMSMATRLVVFGSAWAAEAAAPLKQAERAHACTRARIYEKRTDIACLHSNFQVKHERSEIRQIGTSNPAKPARPTANKNSRRIKNASTSEIVNEQASQSKEKDRNSTSCADKPCERRRAALGDVERQLRQHVYGLSRLLNLSHHNELSFQQVT